MSWTATCAGAIGGGPDAASGSRSGGNRIGRLDSGWSAGVRPTADGQQRPDGDYARPDGNLWFTEHALTASARITPLGSVTEFVLPHPGGPAGIATGPDGNLYIAENSGDRIDRMSPQGRVDEFSVAEPREPADGIVAGADGNIWFTELASRKLGRLSPAGDLTEYPLPAIGTPLSIAQVGRCPVAHRAAGSCGVQNHSRWPCDDLLSSGDRGASLSPAAPTGNLWFTEPTGKIRPPHTGRRTDRIPGRR